MRNLNHNSRLRLFLASLSALLIFSGCSPQWHINKAEKHTEKAIEKGAEFNSDTLYVRDTTIVSYYKNDTVFIEKTVTNKVYVKGDVRYISKSDKRRERRDLRVQQKRDFKLQKIGTRRQGKRSYWFVWLVVGIVLGLLIPRAAKYFV